MRSSFLLLLLASGCDVVFLDEPLVSDVCGPYGEPTPVPFAGLPVLTHFSAVGERGVARETEPPFRLRALAFDGSAWVQDDERQANLDTLRSQRLLEYAQLATADTMFGAVREQNSTFHRVFEYVFRSDLTPPQWVPADDLPVAFVTSEAVLPGGTLVTGAGTDEEYRYHATSHSNATDGQFIAVEVEPPGLEWRTEESNGVLSTNAINDVHAASHAAIALGRNNRPTLIYAGTSRGETTGSELYVSERESGKFQLGVPLRLGDGDEYEPSTNMDCSLLYFRRGDQILQARAE